MKELELRVKNHQLQKDTTISYLRQLQAAIWALKPHYERHFGEQMPESFYKAFKDTENILANEFQIGSPSFLKIGIIP